MFNDSDGRVVLFTQYFYSYTIGMCSLGREMNAPHIANFFLGSIGVASKYSVGMYVDIHNYLLRYTSS